MTTIFDYDKIFKEAKEIGKGLAVLKVAMGERDALIQELNEYNENIDYEVYKVSEDDIEDGDFGYDIIVDVLSVK